MHLIFLINTNDFIRILKRVEKNAICKKKKTSLQIPIMIEY